MWIPSTWENEDDVLRDILLMAEYCVPTSTPDVPETILKYRKQMAENKQKTLNSDIDESAHIIISGRGRGIRDRVIRPGGVVDCHPSDDMELKKQIRQVAGFGYSNELIEKSIKAKGYDPEKVDTKSSFKLLPTSSSSTSQSSAESTPTKKNKTIQTFDVNFRTNS